MKKQVRDVARIKYGFAELFVILLTFNARTIFSMLALCYNHQQSSRKLNIQKAPHCQPIY